MKNLSYSAFLAFLTSLCFSTSLATAQQEVPGKAFGKGHPFTAEELPAGKLKSKLQSLNPEAKEKAMAWLHTLSFGEFDAAEYMRVDSSGGIYTVCPSAKDNTATEPSKPDETPTVQNASVPVSAPPAYNSKPGATRHIYIDFNGGTVTGTQWNSDYGTSTFLPKVWSLDGDTTTFNDAEQTWMRQVWERVAEDYAPFDVNVTTDVTYDPDNYTGNKDFVGWLLICDTTDKNGAALPHKNYGGVAYLSVYGTSSYSPQFQPAWVTSYGTEGKADIVAEAASHEMGHNMGLNHDDATTSSTGYYGGHAATASAPSWGPIMGTGYNRNISQWSKGQFYGAKLFEDDLSIISARVPYRIDDHGNTFSSATVLTNSSINQQGIIERTNDNDVFSFATGAGPVSISVAPYKCAAATWGGNLDAILEIYNRSGALVASSNPAADVTASINFTATAGNYYLVIKPSAAGTPTVVNPSGYTVYGSLGQYKITGSFVPAPPMVLTSPNGGEQWIPGTSNNITWYSGLGGNVKIELFKNSAFNATITASAPNSGLFSWAIPADQLIGSDYKIKVTSLVDTSKSSTSLNNFSIVTAPAYYASMNTNPGWTFDAGWAFGTTTGANQDGIGNPDPISGYNGINVIGYNLLGDYEANLTSTRWAKTPAIDCSRYLNCKLSFYRWLGVEGEYDNAYIEVSNDGNTWSQVWRSPTTANNNVADTVWTYCQYDISAVADGHSTVYVRWGMGVTDDSWQWCGWNLDEVKVDGDYLGPVAAVVITESDDSTDATEGGATDTYTVKLTTQPTTTVNVNITPDAQVSASPSSLSFSTSDWNTPKTVTVTAVQDADVEGNHTGIITHMVTSGDSNYNGIAVNDVTVKITDDDIVSPYIAWSGGSGFYLDSNNDGISNGLAWVLGASSPSQAVTSPLPAVIDDNSTPGYVTFTYPRLDNAFNDPSTTILAEYGTNLTGWSTAVDNGSTVIISVTDDFYGAGLDKVDVKIKKTVAPGGTLFGRLSVAIAP